MSESIESALGYLLPGAREIVPVIFTAHSIPKNNQESGAAYKRQLIETCEAIAGSASLKNRRFAFQSKGHHGE